MTIAFEEYFIYHINREIDNFLSSEVVHIKYAN